MASINPWQTKPWWCQPWSILLTGCSLIAGSWLMFHLIWLTVLVAIPLMVWMGFFLLIWPRLMRQYLEQSQGPLSPGAHPGIENR